MNDLDSYIQAASWGLGSIFRWLIALIVGAFLAYHADSTFAAWCAFLLPCAWAWWASKADLRARAERLVQQK